MPFLKKTIRFFCMIALLVFYAAFVSDAHPTAQEHDKELEKVLFVEGYAKHQSDKIKQYVTDLEYASYLTIDQFKGDCEYKFDALKKDRMVGLMSSFDAIDYSADPKGKVSITPNTHRRYTHQGWDRDYSSVSEEAEKFWVARRKVLLSTVNTIFDFRKITLLGFDDKCNSFAGIIYYVHILGDYLEADSYQKIVMLPDIAGRVNANKIDKDYDMVTSLEGYINTLFEDQKSSPYYKNLQSGLKEIGKGAGKLVQSSGGVNSEEEFAEYHQYAEKLMNLLAENIPQLLKQEEFFKSVFYP